MKKNRKKEKVESDDDAVALQVEEFDDVMREVEKHVSARDPHQGMTVLKTALRDKYAPNATQQDLSFFLARVPPTEDKRNIAILLARIIGAPEFTAVDSERAVVEIFRESAEDLLSKKLGNLQTFEAYNLIREVHVTLSRNLKAFDFNAIDLPAVLSTRNDLMKALRNKKLLAYGQPFDIQNVTILTEQALSGIAKLLSAEAEKSADLYHCLQDVKRANTEGLTYCESLKNFLTIEAIKLFKSIDDLLPSYEEALRDRLSSTLVPAISSKTNALKSYPLHLTGELLEIVIPMKKIGSGVATDVEVTLAITEANVDVNDHFTIARIDDSHFNFTIEVVLDDPLKQLTLMMDMRWREFDGTSKNEIYEVNVKAQNTDTDWSGLSNEEPYSTEPVSGTEFIGRARVTDKIFALLQKANPQSCYITGQKRVGKTSLAFALRDRLESETIHTQYLDWGSYGHPNSTKAINQLGELMNDFIQSKLSVDMNVEFDGALTPLSRVVDQASREIPDNKFIFVLDEFDEIHAEMYRLGPIAETFFANLRTLSSKKNIAFVLVGGEKMPFVIGAQGDQLNKFKRERLGNFSVTEEYSDYEDLISTPTENQIYWSKDAIDYLYRITNGHPFYTKLLCGTVFQQCVERRDNEVSSLEIARAIHKCVEDLDTNAFAHLWKDGISGREEDPESIELTRCKLLRGFAKSLLGGTPITRSTFRPSGVDELKTNFYLDQFCQREILKEDHGEFKITMSLFEHWLVNGGYTWLITDTFGEEIELARRATDDELYIKPNELVTLVESWPVYNGIKIDSTRVQAWLDHVQSNYDKRLLLNLLFHLRILSEAEISSKFREVYDDVKREFPSWYPMNRIQVRPDIMVTYCDGEGKSGQTYASKFAKANKISTSSISSASTFKDKLTKIEESTNGSINGLVIVDDLVGSGDTLSKSVPEFLGEHTELLKNRSMSVCVVVLLATPEGEAKLRKALDRYDNVELFVCETIDDKHYAFSGETIWSNEDELYKAKEICFQWGKKVSSKSPLGYKNQGLLVVLPDRCPNNSLPILHSSSKDGEWRCLFERAKTS